MKSIVSKRVSKVFLSCLTATTILSAKTHAAKAAPHWGSFRDDGVQTVMVQGKPTRVRVYQSILHGIPSGDSWELACDRTPAKVGGKYFPRPTACVKSTVLQPLSVILNGLSVLGLKWTPLGHIGTVGGVTATVLDFGGVGALNMWGVFYVPLSVPTNLSISYFTGQGYGPVLSQSFAKGDNFRGWSWDGKTASYLAVGEDGKTTLYIRPFDGKNFGAYTSMPFAKADNMRGWNWDGQTASYIAVNASGRTTLYIRPFDGKKFGSSTSIPVASADTWRGWSWDGQTASYLALDSQGRTRLHTRSFDGKTFGSVQSQQISEGDSLLGWSLYRGTQSYLSR